MALGVCDKGGGCHVALHWTWPVPEDSLQGTAETLSHCDGTSR